MAKARQKGDPEKLRALTPFGRVAFPHVFEPALAPGGREEAYSMVLVFEPDADLEAVKAAVRVAADTSFPNGEWQELRKAGRFKLPFRKASEYTQYGDPFDVPERIFISTNSRERPGLVDASVKPILDREEFYAGCYARAMVYAHAYETAGNMGVTLFLNNIQKVKDGPRLSGRRAATEDFGPVSSPAGGGPGKDEDLF